MVPRMITWMGWSLRVISKSSKVPLLICMVTDPTQRVMVLCIGKPKSICRPKTWGSCCRNQESWDFMDDQNDWRWNRHLILLGSPIVLVCWSVWPKVNQQNPSCNGQNSLETIEDQPIRHIAVPRIYHFLSSTSCRRAGLFQDNSQVFYSQGLDSWRLNVDRCMTAWHIMTSTFQGDSHLQDAPEFQETHLVQTSFNKGGPNLVYPLILNTITHTYIYI